MARKIEAYLDTSALIAFLDRSDSYHALYRRLFASPLSLLTSALVIAEGHGWFLRRYDQNRAIQFLNFVREFSPLEIQPFGRDELIESTTLVRKFADQSLTMADAHGLVVIREHGIKTCWSTDRHLSLTGAQLAD